MISIGTVLKHYKNPEVQKEMVESARGREVAIRFADKGFGKRPDVLMYPNDVLEFAKQGATSFHVSEEHWHNPLQLGPGLRPQELDEMRKAWDLVLDIDCPDWKLSKIITWLLIRALQDYGIESISCKFSGNKGFHIGVPFEAFPKELDGKPTETLFPDICKKISLCLLEHVGTNMTKLHEKEQSVTFGGEYSFSFEYFLEKGLVESEEELKEWRCAKCQKKLTRKPQSKKYEHSCGNCGRVTRTNNDYEKCSNCNTLMEKKPIPRKPICSCGGDEAYQTFNPFSIVEVDTILISSRHMYRMVYSLHEKSGLASIPFNPNKILFFKKEMASPDNLEISKYRFLDTSKTKETEGMKLAKEALEYKRDEREIREKKEQFKEFQNTEKRMTEFEDLTEAIPEEFFPPCIMNILDGINDGKKRATFVIINFLSNVGYEWEAIDSILDEWNKKNVEPLREVLMKGQLRYAKQRKEKIMPPNCFYKESYGQRGYYKDFGVCAPDGFCRRVKNPANYTLLKAKAANQGGKGGRQKLTEEQKEMRRKHREKLKKEKESKENKKSKE